MPNTEPSLPVVAGLIVDSRGRYLLNQRQWFQDLPLLWEFPGGKVEAGETNEQALVRELYEEIGIRAAQLRCVDEQHWRYDHSRVRISFFVVGRFFGTPVGREGQTIDWFFPTEMSGLQMPEVNRAIIASLVNHQDR